jgi:hypothetical protein
MPEDKFKDVKIAEASGSPSATPFPVPARWRIEVRSGSGANFNFKGAIAHDGQLELIESHTPLDRAFTASRYVALFEAPERCNLQVTAYIEINGHYFPQASSGGDRACKLIFDSTWGAFGAGSL